MGEIKGRISRIIYPKKDTTPVEKNGTYFYVCVLTDVDNTFTEENGVLAVAVNGSGKTKSAKIIGNFPTTLAENQCIRARVKTESGVDKLGNPSFQLKLEELLEFSYDEFNKETIMEYLKQTLQGVKKSEAIAIVAKFGKDTMENLGDEDALASIPGITREKAKSIVIQHLNNETFLKIMKCLENVGLEAPVPLATALRVEF